MSPVLPFDIVALIIDIVGENKDTNLLKELALPVVSYSFNQICSKHLFATIELHDDFSMPYSASSKKGFVKLLEKRPDIVKYIRKLSYGVASAERNDRCSYLHDCQGHLLILPNLLRTISGLNCLTINATNLDWNDVNSSLTSALLHLMHLPTTNHIELSFIYNFPLSNLIPAVNLLRLDMSNMECDSDDPYCVVQSEILPKIREFHTARSSRVTTKLLFAKDGRPALNFMSLRQLSISSENEGNVRYLLQNAKLLEKLHLSAEVFGLLRLHYNLFPIARTLKVLNLSVNFYELLIAGPCEALEAIAGHNWLESLSLEFRVIQGQDSEAKDILGSALQKMEEILVKPGWSGLRQVSFQVSVRCSEVLQSLNSLPDKYLNHLPKLESIAFDFSVCLIP